MGEALLSDASQLLTVDPIVLDAIGVDPVRATDGEQGAACSVRRTNRARAIARGEVRLQVERAGSTSRPIRVDRLNTPVLDGWVVEEQIPRERDVSRIQP